VHSTPFTDRPGHKLRLVINLPQNGRQIYFGFAMGSKQLLDRCLSKLELRLQLYFLFPILINF